MAPTTRTLGRAIRERRRQQGLTQRALASRASVSSRHLGEIERGAVNPRWATVVGIADALGMSVVIAECDSDDALGGTG